MNIKMKRVFTVIVILVLGLGMLLICTTREQTKVQKLILDNTSTADPESEPDNQLVFRNIEEYHRFFREVDLSDSEFQEFIRKENYDMNGIRSKEDLIALKQKLMPVPFPYIANAIITDISILPEYDQLLVRYLINRKDSCAFTIDFTELAQTSRTDEVEQNMHI